MNASALKGLIAGVATVAVVGIAVAQSNPPNTAAANPATGAGQQSSQGTPMGTTGTQGGSTMGSSTTMGGSTMGATTDTTTTTTDMSAPRTMRADRN